MSFSINFPSYGTITVSLPLVANLRIYPATDLLDGLHAIVGGQATPEDGNGGIFTFDSTSTTVDNGVDVIAVNGVAQGRWIKTVRSIVGPTGATGATGPQGPVGDVTPAATQAKNDAQAAATAAAISASNTASSATATANAAAATATATASAAATTASNQATAAADSASSALASAGALAKASPYSALDLKAGTSAIAGGYFPFSCDATGYYIANSPNHYGYMKYVFNADDVARIATGKGFDVRIRLDKGSQGFATAQLYDDDGTAAITTVDFVREGDTYVYRNFIAATNAIEFGIFIQAANAGGNNVRFKYATVAHGEQASVSHDARLELVQAYASNEAAQVVPLDIVPTYGNVYSSPLGDGATIVDGVMTLPPNGGSATLVYSFTPDNEGEIYNIRYISKNADISPYIGPSRILSGSNGDSWDNLPLSQRPRGGRIAGSDMFYYTFVAAARHDPSYDGPFGGIRFSAYNTSTTDTIVISDFVLSKGAIPAPISKARVPAVVKSYVAKAITDAAANSGSVLPVPVQIIDMWGDSETEGDRSAQTTPAKLQALLGIPVRNLGVSGQTTAQIAARSGARYSRFTVTGGQVPADLTVVDIPTWDVNPITFFSGHGTDFSTDPLAGYLGGVLGKLSATRDSGNIPTMLHFQRDVAGIAVPLSPDTPFVPLEAITTLNRMQIVWPGRNDVTGAPNAAQTLTDVVIKCVKRQVVRMTPAEKRWLVPAVVNGGGFSQVLVDANAAIREAFPNNFVDINRAPTAAEIAYAGGTLTSDDNADIAVGRMPRGWYSDGLHFNGQGTSIVAQRLAREFWMRGWVPLS